jgi:putative ABC transport system permease protein
VKLFVAFRILTHEKARSAVAILAIFIAVLMIFLQLGFYSAVPKGGMLVYDKMRFDLMLVSSQYYFQGQPFDFPRLRLYQAAALPEVRSVAPVYQGSGQWLNPKSRLRRDIFIMGFNPVDDVFLSPGINRRHALLERPDCVLVDRATRPMFGPLTIGSHVEINARDVEIVGRYDLGTGFTGLGAVATSDVNFIRIFPHRSLGRVNIGLIMLRPGADADRTAGRLRDLLPPDAQILTRAELADFEITHWVAATATGLVFGFGAVIAVVVGTLILYQVLATQIRRQFAQYAVLIAMGYAHRDLGGIVVNLAMILATIAYCPAVAAAFVIYRVVRGLTFLPITMTGERLIAVLLIALVMSAGSALVSVRTLRRADPVDLF